MRRLLGMRGPTGTGTVPPRSAQLRSELLRSELLRSDLDRRGLLRLGGLAAVGTLLAGCNSETSSHSTEESHTEESHDTLTADKALERLKYGNKRFAGGNAIHPDQGQNRRKELASGQHPIATILSCVDSRVPPELIFDEGLGDLFVIRTAGQVVDKAVLGSIQFGVHELHIPLIMVLGHSSCGAVKATIEAVEKNAGSTGSDVDTLVAAIKPAVERAREDKPADLVEATIRENIEAVVTTLSRAAVISAATKERKVTVIGAEYDLASGKVEFFD